MKKTIVGYYIRLPGQSLREVLADRYCIFKSKKKAIERIKELL